MLLVLLGCVLVEEEIEDITEEIEGLTNPLVVQAAFLGVAEPDAGDDIDLSGTEFEKGSAITVFLADAASIDEMEEAPVEGAVVKVRLGDTPAYELMEEEAGRYGLNGEDGLEYIPTADTLLKLDVAGSLSEMGTVLPPPPEFVIGPQGTTMQDLPIDLSETNYDQVLAVVINEAGDVTWSNQPEEIRDWYEFANADNGQSFVIPGEAFKRDGAYLVGVAGLVRAEDESFENMNTALSSMLAGQILFQPYVTLP
ncbi:MAG TPA: hypothetical protein QGF58_04220 [Myxococcota bacterium]|nr:hypothetical protein [Myxococcota bacterium]